MTIPKDCYEVKLTPLVEKGKFLGFEKPWSSAAIKVEDFPAYLDESNREIEGTEMREILFRGKTINSGKWVYGNLIQERYSVSDIADWEWVIVDPKTVGQYTGIKDANGKKVFEGDILERGGFWGWYVAYEDGGFRKIPINTVQRINWEHSLLEQDTMYYWEIIGNIHDNPELVEEEM